MDKQTLSNYGWIVVVALILAVMLVLATPFGKYVMDGVSSIASGYINASNEAIGDANKQELVDEWESKWGSSAGVGKLNHANIIPSGGVYITSDGAEFNAGDKFPEIQDGDVYKYGDYEYCYGYLWCITKGRWSKECSGECTPTTTEKWSVHYMVDNKKPSAILETINDEPIQDMTNTFTYSKIESIPEIPKTIISLDKTFNYCQSLNNVKIPSHIKAIKQTFVGCSSLTSVEIPYGVTNMSSAFNSCTALITAPKIPNSVTNMYYTFDGCKNLKEVVLPDSVTTIQGAFRNCKSLEIAPIIPSSVTTMSSAFLGCTSLKTAPIIPKNVSGLNRAFENCTSLTGELVIHTSYGTFTDCLKGINLTAQNLIVTGTSTKLNEIIATANG